VNTFFTARLARLPLTFKCSAEEDANLVAQSATDEALLILLQAGEQDALGCLFQRYARVVRHVAGRILRDAAEAEDLVQDLFLFIQRKCAIFDSSKSTARSWIIQMAYHRPLSGAATSPRASSMREWRSKQHRSFGRNSDNESDYSAEAVFGVMV